MFILVVSTMAAYRDTIQLGAGQKSDAGYPLWLVGLGVLAWCVMSAFFIRGASFVGNAAEPPALDLGFFLVMSAIGSWLAHYFAGFLFMMLRGPIRAR
jgi:hypothetical protein